MRVGVPDDSMAPRDNGNIPEEVQILFQKHDRMKFFIAQYEEEWQLLDKIMQACSDLAEHKEKAKHLSLYGPGQPCMYIRKPTRYEGPMSDCSVDIPLSRGF